MPRQTERPRVAGVILAAGASRRMGAGRNKMLLQLEGESLLRRAARRAVAAARGTEAPLVVSRYGDVTAPPLLFRRALFGELLAWSGEGCGKTVVQRHRDEAVYLDWPAQALADVDTPEDFAAAQQLEPT